MSATPGQHVRALKQEIQGLLAKVAMDEALPSAFANSRSVCDEPIFVPREDTSNELELLERCAAYEVELETARLEAAASKARARKLGRESTHASVLEEYEREIAGLRRRCAILRKRNLKLETQLGESPPRTPSARVVRGLEATVARLEAENADLRTRLRALPLAERVADARTRVANRRAKDLDRERRQLEKERKGRDDDAVQLDAIRRALADARRQNDHLLAEREDLIHKLRALRDYVHSLPVATDGPEKTKASHFKRLSECRSKACSVSLHNPPPPPEE